MGTSKVTNKNLKSSISIEVSYFDPTQQKPSQPAEQHEYKNQYLTFKALENCTFSVNITGGWTNSTIFTFSYSINNGKTWTTLQITNDMILNHTIPTLTLLKGKTVLLKSYHGSQIRFKSTGKYDVYGNIMSLLYGDDFKGKTQFWGEGINSGHPFAGYFKEETKLINAKNLILPTLEFHPTNCHDCYSEMFRGCTSLLTSPKLPATGLAEFCYTSMFAQCSSLKSAPNLPATTLARNCYNSMFWDCISLETAPKILATTLNYNSCANMFIGCISLKNIPGLSGTTLGRDCYSNMFSGCISLVTAPALPATTLAEGCYSGMFINCTALTTAPALPATTLADYCYCDMFKGCTALTTAPALPATTLANSCYSGMFQGCTALINTPKLSASSLKRNCYNFMFKNCTKVNYIKALFVSSPGGQWLFGDCTCDWLSGVSPVGTFIKRVNANWNGEESEIIPQGWTVETATS